MIAWPQAIIVGLSCISLGITIAKHGEPQGNHSIWTTAIASVGTYALLYYGGFFSVWGIAP